MNSFNQNSTGTVNDDFLADIYNEYHAKIYKYTLYRVGDHSTAEDLVSEVFEKVVAKYDSYNPQKGKLSTWLFAIVNNTIINHYNKNQHYLEAINLDELESKQGLEDSIIENESKEQMHKALMRLDERSRNIIAFKFGANLTNREIAQIMNLTESNVGSILYRSLRQLRDILK